MASLHYDSWDIFSNKPDLNCAAEVVSLALLVDDVLIDLARRYVVVALQGHVHEPNINMELMLK